MADSIAPPYPNAFLVLACYSHEKAGLVPRYYWNAAFEISK